MGYFFVLFCFDSDFLFWVSLGLMGVMDVGQWSDLSVRDRLSFLLYLAGSET